MRRLIQLLLITLFVILLVALTAGCGASRETLRTEGPKVELRLPPAEAMDLRLRAQSHPQPPPPLPPSVSQEYEGRWLTLFQMDITPSEAAGVPPAAPETP